IMPGSIDYTDHHEIIRRLVRAMDERKVCEISYKRLSATRAKTFYIKPLKIFSHKDTIYLHVRMAKFPGKPYKEPDFDPILPLHRIKNIEITDRSYEFPKDYDFENTFNKNFGVIKEDAFKVEIEFSGWAARFVSERIWSPDQKITKKKDGKIRLNFSASSEPEMVSWLLSFGYEAKVIKPKWLVEEIMATVDRIQKVYA
ncbi:helix-turn-helix transcriptional regulator, partial [Thermodesulfobacteriota bacterium]